MNKCIYCGKEARTRYKGDFYCEKHRMQMRRYGRITDSDLKNEIILCEDYAELLVNSKESLIRVKIDLDDVENIKQYKWSYHNKGYIINITNNLLLHRFVMNCPEDMKVDHVNGDKLDNRKSKLRICTQLENNLNSDLRSDNTSGHKGISWYKKYSKWKARVSYKGKEYHLGYFENLDEAIEVRRKAELDLFGDFSVFNRVTQ